MMKMKFLGTLILSLCIITVYGQKKLVRSGNHLYEQKQYKEAASAYQQALSKNPTFTPGMFNLGNALFQQKNYDASRKVMSATAKQTKDKNVKANANYNIGNTYMQEQKWEDAINAYKEALRNNPQDEAAKYNLSYAKAMMKKNNGGGKNKDKNKDKDKDKQDQNKDQNKDKQDQNKDQQNKDQQNKEKQNDGEDKQDQKNEEQDKHQQPQPSKLSQQQADQLLNALSQEEKKLHDKKEKGKPVKIKVDKDW